MGVPLNYQFKASRWPEKKRRFLEALREVGNIRIAAEAAGMAREAAYQKKARDPKFSAAWDAAYAEAADRLEQEAWRRAVEGVEEPVVSMGKLVRDEDGKPIALRKYSDPLMLALLRAHKPEKYAERKQVEFDVSDRLADRLEAARQRAEAARLVKPKVAPVVVDLRADEGHGCRHSPPGMRGRESDARAIPVGSNGDL
jgi:hypothetical protein